MIELGEPPIIRFAILGGGGREARPFGEHGVDRELASLLISYWYKDRWTQTRDEYTLFRDYALDSGAFSAATVGAKIDLGEYIAYCKQRMIQDPQCNEIFALDVIGDWRKSITNTEAMWAAGVPAIPTYHAGEPSHALDHLAKTYPKIALGGAVGMPSKRRLAWAEACFARVWPKPVHGLGFGSPACMMALPWHSVDASTWILGPARFGRWNSIPKGHRWGSDQAFRIEVDWYLTRGAQARGRWRKQYAELAAVIAANPINP